MLEFLGLEQEAMEVVLACILIGAAVGLQMGALSAYGESSEEKTPPGRIVFLVICILAGVIGLLIGALPAIALFFTFQWKSLLGALFQGAIVLAVTYFISKRVVTRSRRRKYMRNPIVREAVAFCKQHNIVGIQCFPSGLRFFKKIEHPDYCKADIHAEKSPDKETCYSYRDNWKIPKAWSAYDMPSSYAGTIRFSDRGYPDVPDLPMFAGALAKSLGSFDYAVHRHTVQYDTVTYSGNTRTTTHNITVLHDDCFVYSKTACRDTKRQWKQQGLIQKNETAKPAQKPNSWE